VGRVEFWWQLIRLFDTVENLDPYGKKLLDGLAGRGVYSKTTGWNVWKMSSHGFPKTTLDVWPGDLSQLLAKIMADVLVTLLLFLQYHSHTFWAKLGKKEAGHRARRIKTKEKA